VPSGKMPIAYEGKTNPVALARLAAVSIAITDPSQTLPG